MSTRRMPHPLRTHPALRSNTRDAFWILALGLIAAYVFFAGLGAFSPADVAGVTIGVVVLAALFAVHSWRGAHDRTRGRDPRLTHGRERRGF